MSEFDKKQFDKTGDGHLMAVTAGAQMENLGHTKITWEIVVSSPS